jgi:glycosyltransferase involved in cell wall biosynthesis
MLIPVALLEAMARGTICFVSDLPNLKLLVSDGINAIIFDKNNIFDLKEKIIKNINREDLSKEAYNF